MDSGLPNILGAEIAEITDWFIALGEPRYRAEQILDWIYKKSVYSFEMMSNLPKGLRDTLSSRFHISLPQVVKTQISRDGTSKSLLQLADGQHIEAVVIEEGTRLTACLSSQVGCAVGCSFCATGLSGFSRHLSAAEIVGQLLVLRAQRAEGLTNVVMMGMGEPLANYTNVMKAIRIMNQPEGPAMGSRRFTISTAGVIPGIERLMNEDLQVNLAVSLHAPDDRLRDQLVPLNKTYPIASLIAACREYAVLTGRRVTFEYVLLRDVNDSPDHAQALGRLLRGFLCHVNLIPVNTVDGLAYRQPAPGVTEEFARVVASHGVRVSIRKEKGADIDAACGQLRLRDEVRAF
ncbi:MAG: 23S rRNA (adenine(2503)-C(2))-methyltransferase RlmN [Limnochordia bacterium]